MESLGALGIFIGALLIFLGTGAPVAVATGLIGIVGVYLFLPAAAISQLANIAFTQSSNFILVVVPLFVLMGEALAATGIGRDLFTAAQIWLRRLPGALAIGTVFACACFAAVCGSSPVTAATIGAMAVPEMIRKGYAKKLALGVTAAGGTLGILIPPSIPMILYAVMAETSVVQLFVAGIVPGVLGGFGLMATAYWLARRYNLPREDAFSLARVFRTAREALWAFLLPIIILGGIFGGVVTATEGAALAVVAALLVGLVIYRELDLAHLRQAVIEGGVQTAIVMLLVATSALLGTYLTEVQAPQQLAKAVSALTQNKWAVLGLLNLLFLLLGMFLHSAAAIILVVPVVMPLVKAVGIDPVHFGLVVTINLGIGQQTPPVASVLMVASTIAKASIWEVTRVNIWFIGTLLAVLLLVTYVPVTGMGLVNLFYR